MKNKQLFKALIFSTFLDIIYSGIASHYITNQNDAVLSGILFGIVSALISGAIFFN